MDKVLYHAVAIAKSWVESIFVFNLELLLKSLSFFKMYREAGHLKEALHTLPSCFASSLPSSTVLCC